MLPSFAAIGTMSVRIQSAIAVAILQRRIAAGFTATLRLSAQHDGLEPHQILAAAAAGPLDVGNAGGAIAISSVSASRQAEGGGGVGSASSARRVRLFRRLPSPVRPDGRLGRARARQRDRAGMNAAAQLGRLVAEQVQGRGEPDLARRGGRP